MVERQDSVKDLEDESTLAGPDTVVASEHIMRSMEAVDQEIIASDAIQTEETEGNGAYVQLEGGELVMELRGGSDFEVYSDRLGEDDAEEEESVEHESFDNAVLL